MDGMFADEEALGDGVVAEADRNEAKHFELSHGQSARSFPASGCGLRSGLRCSGSRSTSPARATARGLRCSCANSSIARCASSTAGSGRPSRPSTRASSTRARAVSKGAPPFSNRSTASSRWRRADAGSPERANTTPAARLADARSGSVCARAAMSRSSSSAFCASTPSPSSICARHQQLEPRGALGSVLQRKFSQIAIGQIGRRLEVAAIERDHRASERRHRMRAGSLEERHRLVELSLPAPQLAEPREPFARHRRPARRELVGGGRQLALRFIPRAAPHAHRRVLRAAHREERTQAPLPAGFLEPIAPLRRAIVVADAIARRNQVAAREPHQHVVLHLARQHRRAHLVERAQSFGDAARP